MSEPDFDHIADGDFRALMAARMNETAERVESIADAVAKANEPRAPSMADKLGWGRNDYQSRSNSGDFILGVTLAKSRDASEQSEGKATLAALTKHEESWGKATLGTTDATGGYIIPNALVDQFIKPAQVQNIYRGLMRTVTGVNSNAVDIPFRSASPARATIVAWGQTKENLDVAYNGYSATMYTLARIYDLSNQFVRQSKGAAEQDVLQELAAAISLGEAHYIREGTGSTEPYGFVPALTNGPATFRTTHTAAAATVAGSVATAIARAAGALTKRGRRPEAAVMSAEGFAEMLTNGADSAGFFLSGISGPQSLPGFRPGTLVSPWGIPVLIDPDLPTDDLVVGEWSAFKIYLGQSYRVDTSTEAGTRWDTNLTGFRGEEEMGFDARPGVYAGALQYVTDILS